MRRPRLRATLLAALVSALAAGLVGGCSSNGGTDGRPAPPNASSTRPAAVLGFTPRRLELPVYDYQLSPAEYAEVARAKNILIAACMTRYGFSWSAPTPTVPLQDRRYGVIDLPAAQRYGYHLLPTDDPASAPVAQARISKKETDVLTGGQLLDDGTGKPRLMAGYTAPVRRVDGKEVPSGGCAQEAERKLLGRADLTSRAGVVSRINTGSFAESLKDPVVKKAMARWSACMKEAGYDYADPLKSIASARLDSASVPPSEIQLATADVKCKRSMGLIGTWSREESAIQRRMIKENAKATAEQRGDNATRLRNAAAVIRKSGK
jgi:hypothetical protein